MVPGTSPNIAWHDEGPVAKFEHLDFDWPLLLGIDEPPESPGWPPVLHHGEAISVDRDGTPSRSYEAGSPSRVLWAVDDSAPHWSLFASSLAANRSIVLHQGDPGGADIRALWDLCATTECTSMVVDPTYIRAAVEAGLRPAREQSLDRLESITVTAPAPVEGLADWIGEQVGARCRWSVVAPGRKLDDRRLQRSAAEEGRASGAVQGGETVEGRVSGAVPGEEGRARGGAGGDGPGNTGREGESRGRRPRLRAGERGERRRGAEAGEGRRDRPG